MARSPKCLSCMYCRQLRSDDTAKKDWKNNYSCDYMLITGKRGEKGRNPEECLLYLKNIANLREK